MGGTGSAVTVQSMSRLFSALTASIGIKLIYSVYLTIHLNLTL